MWSSSGTLSLKLSLWEDKDHIKCFVMIMIVDADNDYNHIGEDRVEERMFNLEEEAEERRNNCRLVYWRPLNNIHLDETK